MADLWIPQEHGFRRQMDPEGPLQAAGAEGISIFGYREATRLEVASGKIPMSVTVVDSVNRKPSPNSSELTEDLSPSPPAEFEAAVIRPGSSRNPGFAAGADLKVSSGPMLKRCCADRQIKRWILLLPIGEVAGVLYNRLA
jgi:hypothetical protein